MRRVTRPAVGKRQSGVASRTRRPLGATQGECGAATARLLRIRLKMGGSQKKIPGSTRFFNSATRSAVRTDCDDGERWGSSFVYGRMCRAIFVGGDRREGIKLRD